MSSLKVIICLQNIWTFSSTFYIIFVMVIAIQCGSNVSNAEYFASVHSLKKLGGIEMEMIKAFRSYINAKELELEATERFVHNIKLEHKLAREDVGDYLSNPINTFKLKKRLAEDWNSLHEITIQNETQKVLQSFMESLNQIHNIRGDIELRGATMGLARIQKMYDLKAELLANGIINGVETGTNLSWNDCFGIATSLYDEKEFELAKNWLIIAQKKTNESEMKNNGFPKRKFEIEILEYLVYCHYELGQSKKAVKYINDILKMSPNHQIKRIHTYIMNSPPKNPPQSITENEVKWQNYTRLCRGVQIPEQRLRQLKCSLESRNNPHFTLAPLKVEPLSKDPEITLYHQMLSDSQIDQILTEAGDMERSQIIKNNLPTQSDIRISEQSWLKYESSVMKYIYRSVEQITGLDLSNSEAMQVANYGIGGVFEPHHDFISPTFEDERWPGKRFITNMFYLSNVNLGGFTVFPHINIFSRPIKGALISWYNLHRSIHPDLRTLHAGCPVLIGSKKISNIWVHSGFQELRRPCGLKNDAHRSEPYIPFTTFD